MAWGTGTSLSLPALLTGLNRFTFLMTFKGSAATKMGTYDIVGAKKIHILVTTNNNKYEIMENK